MPTVYVHDADKNRYEGLTREQIVEMIATGDVGNIDDGFITKIKELNANGMLKFWVGTTAEYNALASVDPNTLYITTDDTAAEDFNAYFTEVQNILNGQIAVPNASNAANATNATHANTTNISSDDVDIIFSGSGPDLPIAWTYPNGNWLLGSAKIANEIYNFGILFYPYVAAGTRGVDTSFSPIIESKLGNDVVRLQMRLEPYDGASTDTYFAMANVYSKINDGTWNKTSANITLKQIR